MFTNTSIDVGGNFLTEEVMYTRIIVYFVPIKVICGFLEINFTVDWLKPTFCMI